MNAVLKFLFPIKPDDSNVSLFLLALRLLFGGLFLMHGLQKLSNFDTLSENFADPLGIGSRFSLILAVFGEVACSLGCMLGAFYRLALIPMIFTMAMAFFVIHGGDNFAKRELPFIYLILFILMFIAGPVK